MKNFSQITENLDVANKKYIDDGLSKKVNTSDIVQVTGADITKIMSQKAVTDELDKKANRSGDTFTGDVIISSGNSLKTDIIKSADGTKWIAEIRGGGLEIGGTSAPLRLYSSTRPIHANENKELAYTSDIPTNYVTTDTTQNNISGKKSFTNTIVKKSNAIDLNKKPTTGTQWNYIEFTDKNDDRIGVSGSRFDASGYAGVYLQARNGQQLWIASSTPDSNGNTVTKTSTPTPPDTDDSTQIANTAWVRSHNQAIRGFDGLNYYTVDNVKHYYPDDNYFLVAYTDFCVNWQHVCAEMDVVDLDTRRAVYKLKVSGLLESATSNNVTTYTNKGNIGITDSFGERLNTGSTDINNEFFLVCRTTNKGRVRYEIWYNQRYSYNRHKFYFSVDEASARTGITEHFTWNKMRVDNADDVAYAKAGVTAYMDSKKVNPTYIPTSSWGVDVFKTALSDDESYTNVTIFNNNLYSTTQVGVSTILNTTPYIDAKIKGYSEYKTIPSAQKTAEYRILSEDKGYLGGIRYDRYTNGDSNTRLCTTSTLSGASNSVMLYATKGTASTKNTDSDIWLFAPATDNNINLGGTGNRWNNGYITNLQLCKVINGGGGNSLIQQNSDTNGADITVGSTGCPLKIQGSGSRPTYRQGKNGTYANLALQSDIKAQVAYGTCATEANVSDKIVTVSDTTWALTPGTIVGVKFTKTNTASNVTINVNGTGAKNIWYNNAKQTGNSNLYAGYANRLIYYMYDGTYWCWLNAGAENDTIPSAMSWTGGGTKGKTAACHNYNLLAKSYTQVIMISSNTAKSALTLNINGKGAKPIYINGAASSETNYTLPAGSYFVYYDGTNYYFRTDGKFTVGSGLAMTTGGTSYTYTLPKADGQMMVGSLSGTVLTISL